MFPEIFSIGPFTLHSYGLLIALGVLCSLFLMNRQIKKRISPSPLTLSPKGGEGRVRGDVLDLVFVTVFAGFIGARLFYVIQEWPWYQEHPQEIIQIWKGGLVYYGGMIMSFAGFFLYVRWIGLPFLSSADFILPYIALTHAFGRVGCFLNGCCFGRGNHPVQLYEAFFNLSLFAFLSRRHRRRRFAGEITSLYLILYPAGRYVIEYFRGDQPPWLFSLTFHQVLSLIFILLGISLYGICRRRT